MKGMDFNFKLMSRQLVLKHASLDIALLKFVCNRFVLYVLNYLLKIYLSTGVCSSIFASFQNP